MNLRKSIFGMCLLAITAGASAQTYKITALSTGYSPTGLNYNGRVMVGTASTYDWMWTLAGGYVNIGGNSPAAGYGGNVKVSDDGTKISGNITNTVTGHSQMARYDVLTGTWTPFNSFGYYSSSGTHEESSAWGFSGDGNTVVGQGYYNTTGVTGTFVNPMISTNAIVTNLHPNTTNNGRVMGSNYDGSVLGGYAVGTGNGNLWVWNGTSFVESIPQVTYSGGPVNGGQITDITNDGRWACGSGAGTHNFRPYLYDLTNGTGVTIDRLPAWVANARGIATGISEDGTKIIGRYWDQIGGQSLFAAYGFIYVQGTGTMLLDDYVDSLGAARGTLHFYNPAAISGDGKTIISSAYNPSTNTGGTYMIRPEVGVISGTVDLSNLSVSPVGQVITVIVRQGGTDIPVSATLAADGTYSVETGISGAVDILIKGSHWLRASAGNFTLGYTGVTANATLINGDCNPDNEINLADYSALSAAFGSVSGDSNWNPQADLDGDGEVTLADYGILSANFGQAGDE